MRGICHEDGSARIMPHPLAQRRPVAIGCSLPTRIHITILARRTALLRDAADHDAVLVSYSPEQEMETFWERAMIPFVYCRLAARFSFARINDPRQTDAAANGQFLMIRRDAYEACGRPHRRCWRNSGRRGPGAARETAGLRNLLRCSRWSGAHADVSVVWRDVAGLDEKPLPADGRESGVCFARIARSFCR